MTVSEYVWTCLVGDLPCTAHGSCCTPEAPHDQCAWVLGTTPDRGGGRWGGTGAPAPLNRDPDVTTVTNATELRAALKQPDVFATPGTLP